MSLPMAKRLKAQLSAEKPVFGTWVGIPHPIVIELTARTRFDFLLLDGEHSPIDVNALASLLPAAELHGAPTIFRTRWKSPDDIKAALDAGVSGIMVPMIESAEEARAVVSHCRYAPAGTRGIGPWRASGYYDDFGAYLADANDATTLILQLESGQGLANVEEILAVEGFDVLFVGPADLASSLGLPIGRFDGELRGVLARVAEAAREAGKRAAIDAPNTSLIPDLIDMGYSLFTVGSDMGFIQASGRSLVGELAAIAER
ncbi:HpcH/HpaI aldolase/citrate lyase family protein [Shinella sp. NM-101]|uniref:HpcH/HpaI aldolase family protein n=1 Tax=Shinella sp. NM-101 TaxID=2744455 RepID=UPI001F33B0A3|nr:aldolase/citrate lyase family protein [Shinella sp. NM-101]